MSHATSPIRSDKTVDPVYPNANGRGALKRGGTHKRTGRLTKDMEQLLEDKRRKALGLLTQDLDVLHDIAQNGTNDADRIRAVAELRENVESKNDKAQAGLTLNDNRAQIVILPALGSNPQTLEEIDGETAG